MVNGSQNVAMISTFCQFILDLIFSIVNLISCLEISIINNTYLTYRFPYLDNIPVTFNQYCFCVWLFCLFYYSNFAIVSVTIFVQYSFVTGEIKLRSLILMYITGVVLIALSLIYLAFFGLDQNVDLYILYKQNIFMNKTDFEITESSKAVSLPLDLRVFASIGPIFVILSFCFSIIAIVLIKYRRYLKNHENIMTSLLPAINAIVFLTLFTKSRSIIKKRYTHLFILMYPISKINNIIKILKHSVILMCLLG
uniref:G_PROTEIN_RECEP_F1_2 domain-containing protein n=1 Tax=Rhabditophanes sp. KR3021 TaxID=114890 RepID=A0AC35TZ20_9BILA